MRVLSSSIVLVVLEARGLHAGEPGRAVLGEVAGDLHLAGEREHVRRQARLRKHRRLDLLGARVGCGLVEDTGERGEADLENRR
jgi:hypothetical protein